MNILTPSGYKDITSMNIGDEVVAYDINDGHLITNKIESIEYLDEQWFENVESPFKWYLINGKYKIFYCQSIWTTPTTVVHGYEIQIGDTIYDDNNQDFLVTSIEEMDCEDDWIRLEISGDHSFISEGITFHNASRFLVSGGTGNWNSNTNWSVIDGSSSGSSFPVNGDAVNFTTLSLNANIALNVACACTSLTCTGTYAGTLSGSGALTILGTVTFISTMSITATGLLTVGSTATLTSGTKIWTGNMTFGSSGVFTLADDWTVNGNTIISSTTVNSSNIYCKGNLTFSGNPAGTTNVIMSGSGTWSGTGCRLNLEFNTTGAIVISGAVTFSQAVTLKITAVGSLTTTSSTITFGGTTPTFTCNLTGMVFNAIVCSATNTTFNGTNGFSMASFTDTTIATTCTWNDATSLSGTTKAYTITSALTLTGTAASAISMVSASGSVTATLTLNQGATLDVGFVTATRINSSLGRTIWDYKGTLTSTSNWSLLTPPTGTGRISVC